MYVCVWWWLKIYNISLGSRAHKGARLKLRMCVAACSGVNDQQAPPIKGRACKRRFYAGFTHFAEIIMVPGFKCFRWLAQQSPPQRQLGEHEQ